ncbi:MAG: hypothetical protein QFF03_17730 [Pseudomonadota bacterium]|nr:hypothetical protein [Pseudomonadota bacterium]
MSLFVPLSLLQHAGDSKTALRFVLASRDWLELQIGVQALLALPSDLGEYEERYADPAAAAQRQDCFGAMHQLQHTATRYGSPKRLRARILNDSLFLASSVRPKNDAFAATVWVLERAHQDAFALAAAFNGIATSARQSAPAETAAAIRALFLERGQIIDRMQQTVDLVDALIGEFQAIEHALDKARTAIKPFTDRSSSTRTLLDRELGALLAPLVALERARDAACQKWLALAMSACSVPATIAIVGTGAMVVRSLPVANASFSADAPATGGHAAAAAALGIAAATARSAYAGLVAAMQTDSECAARLACYRADLGALDQLMKSTLPSSSAVIGQLVLIKSAWAGSVREFSTRVHGLNADNLRNGPWLKAPEMAASAAGWTTLDAALKAFVLGSFVDADLIDFGSTLPHDDATWQSHFGLRHAA